MLVDEVRRLKAMDMSFEEVIYTIAFELEDEIAEKGKEAVFAELSYRNDMEDRVRDALTDQGYYEMRTEFERIDVNSRGDRSDLGETFQQKVEELQGVRKAYYMQKKRYHRYRYRLFYEPDDGKLRYRLSGGGRLWRDDEPEACIDPGESLWQIHWPSRGVSVLQELRLERLIDAVRYFSDFDNFVQAKKITLWEWMVINAVLRREGLIHDTNEEIRRLEIDDQLSWVRDQAMRDIPEASSATETGRMRGTVKRTFTCLGRDCMNTVRDLVAWFADGARDGWIEMMEIPGFGASCKKQLINEMARWEVMLPPELIKPTRRSPVIALDVKQETLNAFERYRIKSIGELITACKDENRFSGLRYINNDVYRVAVKVLQKYGFWHSGPI